MAVKSFNDITLGTFQECYFLLKNEADELDAWVKVIALLTNKSVETIENYSGEKISKIIKSLEFLKQPNINTKPKKYIGLNGKLFKATLLITDLSTAQGIDIKTFLKPIDGLSQEDMAVKNAHLILASIYKPLTFKGFKYDPINLMANAEMLKKVKFGDISGTLFFYSNVWEKWMQIIDAYTKEADRILTSHMEEVIAWTQTDLSNTGNGR